VIDALFTSQSLAERESDGCIYGLAVAVVTDNHDPDGLARVRVRTSWQEEGQQSYWAYLLTQMAHGEQGVLYIPDVGDQVIVGALRGDVSHLCVLGAIWHQDARPPDTNSNGRNEVRLIRTRKDTELRFFDGDPPSVELKLKDNKRLFLDDQGVLLEDGVGNVIQIETSSGAITIKSTGQLNIESRVVSIKAGATMEIKSSGTLTINGAMVQIN